jgi:CheY-like chemotaxis protein
MRSAKKKILIVEDEMIIAEDLKRLLLKSGYDVTDIVTSGEAALNAVKESKPDLIFMDIVIEGEINGIDAAKQIHDKYKMPIIFLTAWSDDETLEDAGKSDPYGYLLKPVNEKELQATVKMVFNKIDFEVERYFSIPGRQRVKEFKKRSFKTWLLRRQDIMFGVFLGLVIASMIVIYLKTIGLF